MFEEIDLKREYTLDEEISIKAEIDELGDRFAQLQQRLKKAGIPVIIAFIEGVLYLVNGEEAFNKKYNKVQISQENTYNNCSVHIPKEGNLSDTGTSLFKACPKCGQRNEPDSNFCEFCGKKL